MCASTPVWLCDNRIAYPDQGQSELVRRMNGRCPRRGLLPPRSRHYCCIKIPPTPDANGRAATSRWDQYGNVKAIVIHLRCACGFGCGRDGAGARLPDASRCASSAASDRGRPAMCSRADRAQKLTSRRASSSSSSTSPGGGSNIAAEFVVRAPADGYTLFLGTSANTINATFSSNLSFDFAKDLAPIAPMGSVPNLLVVNPSLGVTNVRELIALAKAQPDQISYATSGVGSLSHMAGELLNVPGGHQACSRSLPSAQGGDRCSGRPRHGVFRAGEYRFAARRSRQAQGACHHRKQAKLMAPDIPTMAEAPSCRVTRAPSGTACWRRGHAARRHRQVSVASQRGAARRGYPGGRCAAGHGIWAAVPQDFAKAIEADVRKWREVITARASRNSDRDAPRTI